MPPLTRRFVKTSLVYLVLAGAIGLVLAAQSLFEMPAVLLSFSPLFFHLFMVGWVAQLIFGIVYWMFPKYSQEKPRNNERIAWAVYWLLNAGLILRLIAEPNLLAGDLRNWLLVFSATLQWLAGLAFVANTWPRVKGR